jgi:DMSO/TMAO reductase YedYZ molybdopterin-dependent catalytic subunit
VSTDVRDRPSTAVPAPHPLPRRVGALIGVLAVAAALGVAHLAAGLVQLPSSPYLAVGNAFIDLTPPWLKTFAVDQFGTNDKTALLTGMALVLVALGAGVGLLARCDTRLGVAGVVVLGLVGLVAVLTRPDTTAVGVLAPLVALVAGVGALLWLLHAARTSWPAAVARTPRGTVLPVSRRTFLGTSTAVAAGAGVATVLGRAAGSSVDVAAAQARVGTLTPVTTLPAVPAGADFTADGGLPFITPNADFYRIDTALSVPRLSAADWSLRIHGMVDREITLTLDDLLARELVEQRVTFTCVSYDLGSNLVGTADWVGVSLRDVLLEAGVQDGADQIFSTSVDGFTASTPVDTVMEPDRGAMLAVNMNGEPLPAEHGFPVRMLVPGLFGFVSATKWIVDIELTTYADKQAYWTPRGWSDHGPVKQASKIVSGSSVASGSGFTTTLTGAAWDQHTGITGVEVRLDDGPWQPARMGADGGRDAWRMWRADLTGVPAGEHTAQCRATNAEGTQQTATPAPPNPDGATGWHTVRVKVG